MRINKHITYLSPFFYRNFYGREFKAHTEADLQQQIEDYGKRLLIAKQVRPRLVKLDSIKGVHMDIMHDPETLSNYIDHNGILTPTSLPKDQHKVHVQLQLVAQHERALASSTQALKDILL